MDDDRWVAGRDEYGNSPRDDLTVLTIGTLPQIAASLLEGLVSLTQIMEMDHGSCAFWNAAAKIAMRPHAPCKPKPAWRFLPSLRTAQWGGDRSGQTPAGSCYQPYLPPLIDGNSSLIIVIAAGPTSTTKIAGKMKITSGKISFTAVFAAFSSAI